MRLQVCICECGFQLQQLLYFALFRFTIFTATPQACVAHLNLLCVVCFSLLCPVCSAVLPRNMIVWSSELVFNTEQRKDIISVVEIAQLQLALAGHLA